MPLRVAWYSLTMKAALLSEPKARGRSWGQLGRARQSLPRCGGVFRDDRGPQSLGDAPPHPPLSNSIAKNMGPGMQAFVELIDCRRQGSVCSHGPAGGFRRPMGSCRSCLTAGDPPPWGPPPMHVSACWANTQSRCNCCPGTPRRAWKSSPQCAAWWVETVPP